MSSEAQCRVNSRSTYACLSFPLVAKRMISNGVLKTKSWWILTPNDSVEAANLRPRLEHHEEAVAHGVELVNIKQDHFALDLNHLNVDVL